MRLKKLISEAILKGLFINLIFVSIAWGLTAQQIAQKVFPSVAMLVMEDANGQPVSLGSGFFVRGNIVATNLHVIEGAAGGFAKIVGKKTKYNIAGTVGLERNVDLVLLAIEGLKAPVLTLGNSGQVQVGDEIYAVGNPLGLEGTFSKGMVSGIRSVGSENIFQVTAPISPGSSGGPMVNTEGQVVGVTVATFQGGQNLNFAIPSYYLNSLLSKTKAVKPLSKITVSKERKSAFDSLGKRGVEGVIARKFRWGVSTDLLRGFTSCTRHYSFSIYNKLREPVRILDWLIIFYDKEGFPVEHLMHESSTKGYYIRPRLARIVSESFHESSCGITKEITERVEIRVLNFKIVE